MPQVIGNGYRIREVDGQDEDIADTLTELHRLTFFDSACIPEFDQGHRWLAFRENEPVAFAGVVPSTRACNAGYFCRVGVLRRHRGAALSTAPDAGDGSARQTQWMEQRRFGYHR
jgi:hypothetical protein